MREYVDPARFRLAQSRWIDLYWRLRLPWLILVWMLRYPAQGLEPDSVGNRTPG